MTGPDKTRYGLLAAVVLAIAGICAAGLLYYRAQERQFRRAIQNEMMSVAELKVLQLERWRRDRLLDVEISAESPFVGASFRRLLQKPTPDLRENALQWFENRRRIAGYDILLTDPEGNIRHALDMPSTLSNEALSAVREAVANRRPILTDIYRDSRGSPSLDAIAPLAQSKQAPVVGTLIFHIEANDLLYPLVLAWPVKTESAEALLVRRENGDVLFLNELRHRKATALNLRLPVSQSEVPAVRGALGYEGFFQGTDYRGAAVFAVARKIDGCNWVMIVKEDRSEALAGLRYQSRVIAGVVVGTILILMAFVGMLWQRNWRAHYEDLYRSELALSREKERLAVTLRSIGDGVITTDTAGMVVFMNPVAETLTGWSTSESVGRPLSEIFHIVNEYTKEARENPVAKVLQTRGIVEMANHTMLVSRGNRTYLISDSGAPVFDPGGEMVGVVLVFRDVTEKQRMEHNLNRAQKLEAIGVLAGGLAHDFNNLLAGVFGYLDLARAAIERNTPSKALDYVDRCIHVFDRARDLTQQLLTFAKGGTPMLRTGALNTVLHDSTLFALSGSSVSCQFEIADDLGLCDFDPHQMAQVIDNIVINAKQAMPGGGHLLVRARNTTLTFGQHPQLAAGNYVEISFRDNGIGMPAEILPRIFDPFFSTKQMGSGLGLATVYSIVQRHNGAVDVESEPGKGSTFRILLPVSSRPASTVPKNETVPGGAGRVLVMDDEDALREIVGEMLASLGYEPVLASTGEEAVARVAEAVQQNRPFRAAILDLTVPGHMGGKDAAVKILELNPSLPLIVASGYSNDPVMAQPHEHGFCARIQKPFLRLELAQALSSAISPVARKHSGSV